MKRREFVTLMIGGAASWPRAGRAQQQAMPVIGFLRQGAPEPATLTIAFKQGLSETGISVGRDVTIENRWAEGRYDRLPALASELVSRPSIAVIAAAFLPAALAAKTAEDPHCFSKRKRSNRGGSCVEL
jgi:putative tryptophan/tyrosine transport system substrate-binding protein